MQEYLARDAFQQRVGRVSRPAPEWPAWVKSPNGFALETIWRLTRGAQIVVPARCAHATLALLEPTEHRGRYTLETGTRLRLVETYDPEQATDLPPDLASYLQSWDGWGMRTYLILDGGSTGIRITLPADPDGRRFPWSALLAHAAMEPLDPDEGLARTLPPADAD